MARGGPYSGCPLGNGDMDAAISTLDMRMKAAVTLLTEYTFKRDGTLKMLFAEDTIEKATAAKGIVTPDYQAKSYELQGQCFFMGNIRIDYEGCKTLPITPTKLELQRPEFNHLLHYLQEVEKIYLQYEEVKGVLRWLNTKATIGGIRYYWPSIMKVAPKNSCFTGMETPPKRFETPSALHQWLPALRNTASTVASMALMPDDARMKSFEFMSVTCHRRKVVVSAEQYPNPEASYQTDSITFNA